jgi:16S rRNA C967 or C1407 C5-methylase (RsmB/RsmF family)
MVEKVIIFDEVSDKQENELYISEVMEMGDRFLAENEGYELRPTGLFGKKDDGYVTLFPHVHGTDGFFICRIVKI